MSGKPMSSWTMSAAAAAVNALVVLPLTMLIEGTLMDTIDIRPYLGLERVFADCSQAESRYVQVVANLLHICVKTSIKQDCA
jgi:hypothetical protein